MSTRRWFYLTASQSLAYDIRVPPDADAKEVERRVREHWGMDEDEPVQVWPASGADVSEMDSEQFRTL